MARTKGVKTGYLPTLDGWRAIAVGLVLFNHAPMLHTRFAVVSALQHAGLVGVDVFFAISGLLICSRLLEEEKATGGISLRGFYTRRSFRIFPAAYMFLLVLAILALAKVLPMDWAAWRSSLVFGRNYFSMFVPENAGNRFTGHFWTLAVEEHFYLLLPSLLVLFPRHRKIVLLGLTALAIVWVIVFLHITPPADRTLYWKRRTDLKISSLLFPAWLALFLATERGRERLARYARPFLIPVLAGVVLVWWGLERQAVPFDFDAEQASARFFLIPLVFPFLILATMLHPASWLSRLLEWRPLRAIGRVSYSVYVWQEIFWAVPYQGWPISHLQSTLAGGACTVVASLASYFLLEKPFVRLGHRLSPPVTPGHRDLDMPKNDDEIPQSS